MIIADFWAAHWTSDISSPPDDREVEEQSFFPGDRAGIQEEERRRGGGKEMEEEGRRRWCEYFAWKSHSSVRWFIFLSPVESIFKSNKILFFIHHLTYTQLVQLGYLNRRQATRQHPLIAKTEDTTYKPTVPGQLNFSEFTSSSLHYQLPHRSY